MYRLAGTAYISSSGVTGRASDASEGSRAEHLGEHANERRGGGLDGS